MILKSKENKKVSRFRRTKKTKQPRNQYENTLH